MTWLPRRAGDSIAERYAQLVEERFVNRVAQLATAAFGTLLELELHGVDGQSRRGARPALWRLANVNDPAAAEKSRPGYRAFARPIEHSLRSAVFFAVGRRSPARLPEPRVLRSDRQVRRVRSPSQAPAVSGVRRESAVRGRMGGSVVVRDQLATTGGVIVLPTVLPLGDGWP